MNERIAQLKESAQPKIDWESRHYVELNNGEKQDYYNRWFKQFAELIVRECMWKIMVRKDEAIDNRWHVDEAMSITLSDISEHFGVKE